MTITTDNASNNVKMMKEFSLAMEQVSGTFHGIVRAPCLAHVIQLSLNKLIYGLRIQAKNERIITTWAENPEDREKYTDYAKANGVLNTLRKVYIPFYSLYDY